MAPYLRQTRDGVDLLLLVQPRAARTRLVGEHGGRLKISVASPPADGKANEALLAFLAETLAVARRDLALTQGQAARQKVVRVQAPLEQVARALEGAR